MSSAPVRTMKTRSCPPEPENIAAAVKIYHRAARNPFFSSGGRGSSSLFSGSYSRNQHAASTSGVASDIEGVGLSTYPPLEGGLHASSESGVAGNVNHTGLVGIGVLDGDGEALTSATPREGTEGMSEEANPTGKKKPITKERHLITWSLDEKTLFFQALQLYGKSFHEICRYVNRRSNIPSDMKKTREQVRMFYQRMWQKIRPYVQMTPADLSPLSQPGGTMENLPATSSTIGGNTNYMEETAGNPNVMTSGSSTNIPTLNPAHFNKNLDLYALINYSVLRMKIKNSELNARLGKRLNRLIMKGKSLLRWKGRSFMLYTPICPALKRLNLIQAPELKYVLPEQICLNLVPRNEISLNRVVTCEQNPRLRITVSVNRQLSDVIHCLETRWTLAEQRVRKVLELQPSNAATTIPRLRFYLQDSHNIQELQEFASTEAANRGAAIFVQAIPRVRSEEISFLSYLRRQQGLPVTPCIDPPPRGTTHHSYNQQLSSENETNSKPSTVQQRQSNVIRLDVRSIADKLQQRDGVGLEEAREIRLLLLFLALSCPNQINFEYDYMTEHDRMRIQDPLLCNGMSHILRRVIDLSAGHFIDLERQRTIADEKRYAIQQLEARIAELRQTETKLLQNCEEMRQCLTAALQYPSEICDDAAISSPVDMFHQQLEEVCKKPVVNRNVETFQESSSNAVTSTGSGRSNDTQGSTVSSSSSVTTSTFTAPPNSTYSMAAVAKLKSSLEALKRHNRSRRNPRLVKVFGGAAGTSTSAPSSSLSNTHRNYPPPPLFHSSVPSVNVPSINIPSITTTATSTTVPYQHALQSLLTFQANNAQVATPASYVIQMVPAGSNSTLQPVATFSSSIETATTVYLTPAPPTMSSTISSNTLMSHTSLSSATRSSQQRSSNLTRKFQPTTLNTPNQIVTSPVPSQSDDFNINDMFSDSQFSISGFSGATNDIMDHAYGMVMLCDEEEATLIHECDTESIQSIGNERMSAKRPSMSQCSSKSKKSHPATKMPRLQLPAVENPEDENAQMPYTRIEASSISMSGSLNELQTAHQTDNEQSMLSQLLKCQSNSSSSNQTVEVPFGGLQCVNSGSNVSEIVLDSDSMQTFLYNLVPQNNSATSAPTVVASTPDPSLAASYSNNQSNGAFPFSQAFIERDEELNNSFFSTSLDIENETSVSLSGIPDLTGYKKKKQ